MPKRNSTVKIENGKVVFSQEIIDYFENLRNEENNVWIDKYFEVLSDTSNFNAPKYNIHHIIPCFTFKDKTHKIRKETRIFADKIKENLIKLSIYNHILAHYCLWRIFKTNNSKSPVILMCNNKYIESLTENQIKEIAKLQEEISKENMTEEEKAKYGKEYRKNNKQKITEYRRKYERENREKIKEKRRKYQKEHKEERNIYLKKYRDENEDKINKYKKEYRDSHKEQNKLWQKKYSDSHKEETKAYRDSHKKEKAEYDKKRRIEKKEEIAQKKKEYYLKNRDKISRQNKIKRELNKDKIKIKTKEYYENNKDKISEKGKQLCFDPIKNKPCTLNALNCRKQRNKELYKDVIPTQCIIKN